MMLITKNPVNKDKFGADQPLEYKIHRTIGIMNGNSKLQLDIIETTLDRIVIDVYVDGKNFFINEEMTAQIFNFINEIATVK